jgi:hypothetical protein
VAGEVAALRAELTEHPRSVFDRYSIRVEEQTRTALQRTTDYTTTLRKKERTVVSLSGRRAG